MAKNNKDLLLEIGVEELPSDDVWAVIKQLEEKTPHLLKAQKIEAGKISISATPRRLVIYVKNIQEASNVQLERMLVSLIGCLRFKKTMRWMPDSQLTFSRPVRWLVALLDNKVINIKYANVKSSDISYGPRFLASPKIKIKSASQYFSQLKKNKVIVDYQKRKELILKQSQELAKKVNGKIIQDEDLLDEITHLVEFPFCILCEFDKKFLKIPSEVSVTVMKKHQRYFPIVDKKKKLLQYFIVIANQLKENASIIKPGNEKVVGARLSDGEFFYNQDRGYKLGHFRSKLKDIIFHEKLGSVYDKTVRLEKLSDSLASLFNLTKEEREDLKRAAYLCKADLGTALVVEFSSLQGEIGRIYAKQDKEKKTVCDAIYEHRLPNFSGDKLPFSKLGKILSVIDRLDTLAGFFAVNIRPDGSQDPYALRRSALGLVQILSEMDNGLDLRDIFEKAGKNLPVDLNDKELEGLIDFIRDRIRADFRDKKVRDDVVRSVLNGPLGDNIYLSFEMISEVSRLVDNNKFKDFIQTAKRVDNISKNFNFSDFKINTSLFEEKAENDLYRFFRDYHSYSSENKSFKEMLKIYLDSSKYTNNYFNDVLVMAEDEKVKENRLGLLFSVGQLFKRFFLPSEINK